MKENWVLEEETKSTASNRELIMGGLLSRMGSIIVANVSGKAFSSKPEWNSPFIIGTRSFPPLA